MKKFCLPFNFKEWFNLFFIALLSTTCFFTNSNAQDIIWLESINNKVRKVAIPAIPVNAASATNIANASVPLFHFIDAQNGFVYWSDNGTGTIKKAPVNGGAVTDVVTGITGVGVYVQGIYLDVTNSLLYWTQTATGVDDKVRRVDISGALPKAAASGTDLVTGIANVRGVAVDNVANQVYFADGGLTGPGKGIYRVSLSAAPVLASAATQIVATPISGGFTPQPNDLFLDRTNNFIYWSDYSNPGGKIQRATITASSYPVSPTNVFTGESIRGISIDIITNTIYWIEPLNLRIRRASLTTVPLTTPTDVVTNLSYFPRNVEYAVVNVVLPVTFTHFNSLCASGDVKLNWKTAQEFNSKTFNVERTIDGRNWEVVGSVNAAGFSNNERSYTFIDRNSINNAQYRIVEYDADGKKTISSTIRSTCSTTDFFVVYPTRVHDFTTVSINVNSGVAVKLQLFDSKGALVKTIQTTLLQGNNQLQLNMSGLAKGVYTLSATWGNKIETNKLIKE